MSAMRRVRPVWAVVAAACAVVVVASVVGSVATGMGWWEWQAHAASRPQVLATCVTRYETQWAAERGGVHFRYRDISPFPLSIPIPPRFTSLSAWMPRMKFAPGHQEVVVPFWSIGTIAFLGGAFAAQRLRRIDPKACCNCGYDLAGLSSGVCPECGSVCSRQLEEACE